MMVGTRRSPPSVGRRRKWGILAVVNVAVLVVFMDGMVLNVALPRIQQELHASQSEQEWAIAAYTLVFAVLLLPLGVVGDRFGRRHLLAGGLALFGAGSWAAASSWSPLALILMRAVMGIGAAAIVPATLSVITQSFDEPERGRAIGLWAGTSGLAAALGPLVGGALLDAGFWWGSVLMINVPIVLVAMIGVRLWVPESRSPTKPRLDPKGVLLSVVGLALVVFGLIRAGQTGSWFEISTLGSLGIGMTVLAWFVHVERRTPHAILDMRWFRSRSLVGASTAMALATFAMFGAMLYGTYFVQFDLGYGPLGAGALLLGAAIAVMVAAPLSAILTRRWGPRLVCGTGLAVLAASYVGMTAVNRSTSVIAFEILLVLLGAGSGLVLAPTIEIVMAAIPTPRAGVASAYNSAVRSIGGALGIAVLGSVLSTGYRSRIGVSLGQVPTTAREVAAESIGGTQLVVSTIHDQLADHGEQLLEAASFAFSEAMHVTALVSAAVVLAALVVSAIWLPGRKSVPL